MFDIITPLNASSAGGQGSPLMSLMPIFIIFGVMYFLIIRPQNKRTQDHKKMVEGIKRGDRVVVLGGIMALVTKVIDENEIEVESAGSTLKVLKSSVNQVVSKTEPRAEKKDSKASKLKVVKKK